MLYGAVPLPAAPPPSATIAGRAPAAAQASSLGPPGATIRLPGAEQLTGGPLASAPVVTVSPNYVSDGFKAGATEVYLAIAQNGPPIQFPPGMTGGMAGPTSACPASRATWACSAVTSPIC